MTDQLHALEAEVARFRAWAAASRVPPEYQSGEWAAGYPKWSRIHRAFDAFIATSPCREWTDATTELVLYAIALNDEFNYLIKSLARSPDELLCLAEHAVTSLEPDARWQVAAELGKLGSGEQQAETLLLRFMHDEDEYVRRRALLALADLGSSTVASVVDHAWTSGDEYQRDDILYILWKTNSPQLAHFLSLAVAEPPHNLDAFVARIRYNSPM